MSNHPLFKSSRLDAWWLAYALAAFSMVSVLALAGLSGWILGAVLVAGAGSTALALPAALIRVFALLRTGTKYGERLIGHRAAIRDQIRHRARLFSAFARAKETRRVGWQLSKTAHLSDFLDDVDAMDYDALRTTMPIASVAAGSAVLVLATAAIAPLALMLMTPLMVAVFAWPMLLDALCKSQVRQRDAIRLGAAQLGATLSSIIPLEAERRRSEALGQAIGHVRKLEAARSGDLCLQSNVEAAVRLVSPAMAVAVILAAVAAGNTGPWMLAALFLAFAWMGLGEISLPIARAGLARVKARAAEAAITERLVEVTHDATKANIARASTLTARGLIPASPTGHPLHAPLKFQAAPGSPVAVTGPSGCGKTSLLKQLAGWVEIPTQVIFLDAVPVADAALAQQTHLSLHDAAILSDTVRENLFAPSTSDDAVWVALDIVELSETIVAKGGLDAWITQDSLSMGEAQRLNIARAILSSKAVILLDEPWEHLDTDQASRIAKNTLNALCEKIVVFSTHKALPAVEAEIVSLSGSSKAKTRPRAFAKAGQPIIHRVPDPALPVARMYLKNIEALTQRQQ